MAVIFTALAIVSCSSKEGENYSAKDSQVTQESSAAEDIVVLLDLYIDGCVCKQYSEFNITWDKKYSSQVNGPALISALMEANKSGTFLCDCSHGEGKKYASVVKSIKLLSNENGVKIVLTQKVWLDLLDVVPNMENLLEERKQEVFYGHQFKIY